MAGRVAGPKSWPRLCVCVCVRVSVLSHMRSCCPLPWPASPGQMPAGGSTAGVPAGGQGWGRLPQPGPGSACFPPPLSPGPCVCKGRSSVPGVWMQSRIITAGRAGAASARARARRLVDWRARSRGVRPSSDAAALPVSPLPRTLGPGEWCCGLVPASGAFSIKTNPILS